jgi:hypothetical protein
MNRKERRRQAAKDRHNSLYGIMWSTYRRSGQSSSTIRASTTWSATTMIGAASMTAADGVIAIRL